MASPPHARIDDRGSYRGLPQITLGNSDIQLDVLPTLGAKVFNLVHRKSGANLLWHHPRLEPAPVTLGASYDDNFSGGWDELFPNDAPGPVNGRDYPDHGELWCQAWEHHIEPATGGDVTLYLRRPGTVAPALVEKWITLAPTGSVVRFRHRITNTGKAPFSFLWKLHPALVIEGGDRIDVPARTAELVDPSFGRISEPTRFPWPVAKPNGRAPVDFSNLPPNDGTQDFLYLLDLDAGWCALRRMRLGLGFGMAFPRDVFRSVWLFMTYGGWRGLHALVLEPCTTHPKDLNEAIRRGTTATLAPGAALDVEVAAVVFEGTAPVKRIETDGRVVH